MTAPAPAPFPLHGVCVDPATGLYTDPIATPLLGALMQACVDLYDSVPNADAPCAWLIVAGDQVNVERGAYAATLPGGAPCAGLLTVRLVSLEPIGTSGLPLRSFAVSWNAHVEVGVWRPAPEPVETGDGLVLPTVEEEQAAAEQTYLDAAIVRAALLGWADETDTPITFDSFLPWGPMGGVVGGATSVQFQLL